METLNQTKYMRKITLISIFALSILSLKTYAQTAYDGIDEHFAIGYRNVGKTPGIEIEFENATNEYISLGGFFTYLINPGTKLKKETNEYDGFQNFDEYEKFNSFFNSIDAGFFARLHIGTFFNSLNQRIDPFAGIDVSLKSIGANVGVKYQITDVIGVYAKYTGSFSGSVYGLDVFKDNESVIEDEASLKNPNFFGKKDSFSVGISIAF